MKIIFLLLLIIFSGCNSSRVVNTYRNKQELPIKVNKVLIIGISPDLKVRETFEIGIQRTLRKKNILAIPSLHYFSNTKLLKDLSREEINQLEKKLLSDNFNVVVLTRVVSIENKESLVEDIVNVGRIYSTFKQDYFENQFIYSFENKVNNARIFHTETAVYHITEDDRRDILWRGAIDIINPKKMRSSIKQYIKVLNSTLEKENIFAQ